MALNLGTTLKTVASRVVVLKFQEELEKRRQQVAVQPQPPSTPPQAITERLRAAYPPLPPAGEYVPGGVASRGPSNPLSIIGRGLEAYQQNVVKPLGGALWTGIQTATSSGMGGPVGVPGGGMGTGQSVEVPTSWSGMRQKYEQAPALAQLPLGIAADPMMWSPLAAGRIRSLAEVTRPFARAKAAELYPTVREAAVGGEAGGLKLPWKKTAEAPVAEVAAEPKILTPEEIGTQKLTSVMNAAKKASPEYTAALRQKRLEMAPQIDAIRKNVALSPEEMSSQIAAVRKGTIERAFQLPEDLAFTPEEIQGYGRQIFASDVLKPQESKNAYDALMDVLSGLYIPPNRRTLLAKVFGPDFGRGLDVAMGSENLPLWKKIVDIAGIPRILKSALDISFPLRQGVMKIGSKEFWQMWKPMFKAVREKSATESYQGIITDPAWEAFGKDSGIAIADPTGRAGVAKTVEGYVTYTRQGPAAWVERQVGIKQSQEMYATAGNELRWNSLKNTVAGWDKIGATYGPEQIKAAARWQNITTGWGYLGNLDKDLPTLSQILFAPRFWASRLEALPYGAYLIAKEPLMRAQVMRDLVTFAAVNIGLLATLKLSGLAEVELDPRSTDFGRARIGPTRIDLLGGMQPVIRQVAQLMSSQGKSAATGEIYDTKRLTMLGRTLQGKLSPQAGFLVDVLSGKTFVGEEMSLTPESMKAQAWNRLAPMAIADLVDAVQAHGILGGIPFAALAATGGSVLTYESPFDKKRVLQDTIAKDKGYDNFDKMAEELGTPKANEITDADPRIVALQPEIEKYKETRGGRTMADIAAPFEKKQGEDDAEVAAGTMDRPTWLANFKERQKLLGARYEEYLNANPDAAKRFADEAAKIKDPFALPADATPDTVRTAYFTLFDKYGGETGEITAKDWDTLGPELDRFRASLTPTQEASLDENLGAGKSDLVKEYRADQKKMQPFWDLTENLWAEWTEGYPLHNMTYQQYVDSTLADLRAVNKGREWLPRDRNILGFSKYASAQRTRFLSENPDAEAILVKWGHNEVFHTGEAGGIYHEETGLEPRYPVESGGARQPRQPRQPR